MAWMIKHGDMVEIRLQRIRDIYRTFRSVSNNAHGNGKGFSEILTPDSLFKIIRAANVFGSNFVDIGCSEGKPMAAALAEGAASVHGFELPRHKANSFIFEAAMTRIERKSSTKLLSRSIMSFKDIDKVRICHIIACIRFSGLSFSLQVDSLPKGTNIVYSFWVGMPYFAQVHILDLCACCDSVDVLVVFRDGKWRVPDHILEFLEESGYRKWLHHRTFASSMSGSIEKKIAWMFIRE